MNKASTKSTAATGAFRDAQAVAKPAIPDFTERALVDLDMPEDSECFNEKALSSERFKSAVSAAFLHFNLIRKKFPDLKAYLVVGLPGEEADLDAPLEKMLEEFHAVLIDNQAKAELMDFLKVPLAKTASDIESKRWNERLAQLVQEVNYNGKCFVEIRFHQLKYELVWKLQVDELVDRATTPQTKASIRIVLGTIACFADLQTPSTVQNRRIKPTDKKLKIFLQRLPSHQEFFWSKTC